MQTKTNAVTLATVKAADEAYMKATASTPKGSTEARKAWEFWQGCIILSGLDKKGA